MSDVSPDGPPDEVEPAEVIRHELDAFAHHPRKEAARLRELADEGESGATPFIIMARLMARLLPLVAVAVGTIFGVYYLTR